MKYYSGQEIMKQKSGEGTFQDYNIQLTLYRSEQEGRKEPPGKGGKRTPIKLTV